MSLAASWRGGWRIDLSEKNSILVIDDEESICTAFGRFFEGRGWAVRVAASGGAGVAAYREARADVVFLDVRLPDGSGLDRLAELKGIDPGACVIVITAYGSLETVRSAVQRSAFDYLVKPLDLDRAQELARRAVESRRAMSAAAVRSVAGPAAGTTMVGASRVMQEVYKRIGLVAAADAAVLILGETGTGKELVARAVHEHSGRKAGPFVAVNCGSLPESLVESELFGHVRGAFTGADVDRPGRFEAADGGTLFLDEVGELPPASQVKLLRVLDSQTIERLGSVKPIPLDVRVLAATNRDLAGDVRAGRFRADLYYRLAVMQVELPALRARPEDVLPLARHFLAEGTAEGAAIPPLSDAAAEALGRYDWPGNVRELRNAIGHAAVVAGGGQIRREDLPESVLRPASAPAGAEALCRALDAYLAAVGERRGDLHAAALGPVERAIIERALRACGGNQTEAARMLGLHRNTLRNKIRELGLDREEKD